ncbi:hypothetical protein KBC04_01210 [Candidatus Babeliales bacterium]|nr:hypothetical protein [Candidatus Babeliales bacterium]MBP9843655.1 hypothetical protein [Candidatus Babeliales bacterium]
MNTNLLTQITVIQKLLERDFYLFKQLFLHRLKMALYWVLITVFVTKMFMPAMGLPNFAPFILISSAISYGFFVAMHNAMSLVEDITGDQAILYELSLPVPQWAIFFKFALTTMFQSFVISISIVPFGLMVLMDLHAFKDFSWAKFMIIFIVSNVFYGSFSLILATFLKNMSQIDNVWLRILFPMWYLGCYQFPWSTLYEISPTIAYLSFLNPMTFIAEGARSATINTAGSLPFSVCCFMILFYAAISCIAGIYWMKKRLDCL